MVIRQRKNCGKEKTAPENSENVRLWVLVGKFLENEVVDLLQICGKGFTVFVGNILQRVANLVDNAALVFRIREC